MIVYYLWENNIQMPLRVPSAKELAERSSMATLPEDEYLATVIGAEYQEPKPTQWNPDELRDQYIFKLRLESFADGSPLEDTKGEAIKGDYILNAFIDHNRIGMIPQPSRARKFFAALLQQPVGDKVEIEDFPNELIGKQLFVGTVNKPGREAGVEFTRAQEYRPIKINRGRRSGNKSEASEPQVNEAPSGVEIEDDAIKF